MKTNLDVNMTLLCNFRYLLPILEIVKFLRNTILRKLWHEQSNTSSSNSACNWLKFSSKNHRKRTDEFQLKHFKLKGISSEKSRTYSGKMCGNTCTAIATSSTYNMFKLEYTAESLVKSRSVSPSVSTIIYVDTCHENSDVSSMNKNIRSKPFWHYIWNFPFLPHVNMEIHRQHAKKTGEAKFTV